MNLTCCYCNLQQTNSLIFLCVIFSPTFAQKYHNIFGKCLCCIFISNGYLGKSYYVEQFRRVSFFPLVDVRYVTFSGWSFSNSMSVNSNFNNFIFSFSKTTCCFFLSKIQQVAPKTPVQMHRCSWCFWTVNCIVFWLHFRHRPFLDWINRRVEFNELMTITWRKSWHNW